ncbi:MAG: CRTAC1 family protein [Aureliella sp.]
MRCFCCALKVVIAVLAIDVWPTFVAAQEPFAARFSVVEPEAAGIDFVHTNGGMGEMFITETVMGGLATFDYDGDGLIDVYFVNGASIQPGVPAATNRLYRNLGNWQFVDVTEQAGVGHAGCGMGAVAGDIDNDGDVDLFITNYGENVLYRNDGDGTFHDVTAESKLETGLRFGAGSSLTDIDGDGDLDLYTASYVQFKQADHFTRTINGHEFPPGPNDFPPERDYLFRNNADGTFTDISTQAGIAKLAAPGMGVVSADFDADGDADIWVANDQQLNYLLLNDGKGNFEDQGLLAGLAFDLSGRANGNMGGTISDLDGDGQLDLITTTYQEEMPVVYLSVAPGIFEDATNRIRLDRKLYNHVSWGCNLADFDNDGDQDLFLACGHFLTNLRFIDDRTTFNTPNYLIANDGGGRLRDVSQSAGPGLAVRQSSRGSVAEDLDNDGDLDLIVLNDNAAPSLLRNEIGRTARSVLIKLVGTQANREGVGARIVVGTRSQEQTAVLIAGSSYESCYGSRLHFALDADQATVVVYWPNAAAETFDVQPGERILTLVQGTGTAAP